MFFYVFFLIWAWNRPSSLTSDSFGLDWVFIWMLISKRKNNDYFNADVASIELLRRVGLNPELLELLNINNIEIEKEKCKSNKKILCVSSIQPVNRAELSQDVWEALSSLISVSISF